MSGYASTAATSVSIAGDIGSQLHGGYFHPLARSWQSERQLTKVRRDSQQFGVISVFY
jgi:porphobilinogen synthase